MYVILWVSWWLFPAEIGDWTLDAYTKGGDAVIKF
jgi:hypothetical protein